MEKSGKLDEAKGRMREAYGDLTGNRDQKNKGMVEKAAGKVKQGVEHARQKIEKAIDERHQRK